jgi:hypothetical protein
MSKETFEKADADAKLSILFDLLCVTLENQANVIGYIRSRKVVDTSAASAFGFIGGVIAHIAQRVFHI